MAPKSPLKKSKANIKHTRGNVQSRSKIPQRSKTSLAQGAKKDASTVVQKEVAVASTSKVPRAVPAAGLAVASTSTVPRAVPAAALAVASTSKAPAFTPYQSTPKRAAVPVKPSRVASVSPELLKKVISSQAAKHKLKGSPRAQQRRSPHSKENQRPGTGSPSSQKNIQQSPLSSQNLSKVLLPETERNVPSNSSSLQALSPRPSTVTVTKGSPTSSSRPRRHSSILALKTLNASSSGGPRRQSIHRMTQSSKFVLSKDEARRRSSRAAATTADLAARRLSAGASKDAPAADRSSKDAPPADRSSTASSSSPERKPNKSTIEEINGNSIHESPTSRRQSPRRSTSREGTVLHARRRSGSGFHTPTGAAVIGTPGRLAVPTVNTPFRSQAPKSARRRSPVPLFTDPKVKHTKEQLALWDQQIKEWLHRPWKLCFMSALTAFEVQTPNQRSAYQKNLRQLIGETVPFAIQVSIEPRHCFSRDDRQVDVVTITVSFSVPVEWAVSQQRQTAAAAMATADAALAAAAKRHHKKNAKKKGKGPAEAAFKKKTLYTALLVRADQSREAEGTGVVWYPLYFYAGRESVHHTVLGWLQDSFGSLVCLRHLRAPALLWASGLWMQQPCAGLRHEGNHGEQVVLEYHLTGLSADGWQQHARFPNTRPVKDVSRLKMEVPVGDMRNIAACIVPEESAEGGVVTEAERDLLHSVLQEMAHFTTKLPHSALRLKAVTTACVAIRAKGEVKVMCRRHLRSVLDFLLELHKEDSLLDQANGDSYDELDSIQDSVESEDELQE